MGRGLDPSKPFMPEASIFATEVVREISDMESRHYFALRISHRRYNALPQAARMFETV